LKNEERSDFSLEDLESAILETDSENEISEIIEKKSYQKLTRKKASLKKNELRFNFETNNSNGLSRSVSPPPPPVHVRKEVNYHQ
jgi:hypothetical protein